MLRYRLCSAIATMPVSPRGRGRARTPAAAAGGSGRGAGRASARARGRRSWRAHRPRPSTIVCRSPSTNASSALGREPHEDDALPAGETTAVTSPSTAAARSGSMPMKVNRCPVEAAVERDRREVSETVSRSSDSPSSSSRTRSRARRRRRRRVPQATTASVPLPRVRRTNGRSRSCLARRLPAAERLHRDDARRSRPAVRPVRQRRGRDEPPSVTTSTTPSTASAGSHRRSARPAASTRPRRAEGAPRRAAHGHARPLVHREQ